MKKNSRIRTGHAPKGFRPPPRKRKKEIAPTELSKATSSFAETLFAEGMALHQAGRLAEAEKVYNRALTIEPDHFDSLHLLGAIFLQRGNHAEAICQIDLALKRNPNNSFALNNRGVALKELKRFEEALASFDRALALQPNYADALSNRGLTLYELRRFEEALASFDHALTLRPDYAEALSNRGLALHELKRPEDALASYDRALMLRPDYAEALLNRGVTLYELKRFAEALANYDRALIVRPDYAEALSNRGNALKELKRFEEALASYDRALTLRPDYAQALLNRGVTLYELKRFAEALASYDRALAVRQDYAEAHHNEALCRLLIGDFKRGWAKHEWRWETGLLRSGKRTFAQPLWVGSNEIAGQTILLHAEQGFGDTIQFCRYVPRVAARGARVVLEVPTPLHELMSTLPGAAQIISRGDQLPDFDMHCSLLSLPLAFGTRLATIPADIPYLSVSKIHSEKWKQRLSKSASVRVGINWAGNATFKGDINRSIGLPPLLPLLSNTGAQFFSIQKDLRAGDSDILQNNSQITHLGEDIETFSDMAAIISLMDLVISSDTAVVHLAGALGKPVWVLLQFVPDWRWLLDREDSPWYPTARLFRQDDTREWDNVVARVHAALRDYVRRALPASEIGGPGSFSSPL